MFKSTQVLFKSDSYSVFHAENRNYKLLVFNRPGVAGAVLQTPPSLINLLSQSDIHPLRKYLR